MAPRKCNHGQSDRYTCARCADDANHGGRSRGRPAWSTPVWQKKILWWKAKAARRHYETEESYTQWLGRDRARDASRRGMT